MIEIKCNKNGTDVYVNNKRLERVTSVGFKAIGHEKPECWVEVVSEDLKHKCKVYLMYKGGEIE